MSHKCITTKRDEVLTVRQKEELLPLLVIISNAAYGWLIEADFPYVCATTVSTLIEDCYTYCY